MDESKLPGLPECKLEEDDVRRVMRIAQTSEFISILRLRFRVVTLNGQMLKDRNGSTWRREREFNCRGCS